jgi:hypothetical protein
MKQTFTKVLAATIFIATSTTLAGPGDVGSVVTQKKVFSGYKCKLLTKTMKITGGKAGEAIKNLYKVNSINVFGEKQLMWGILQPIAPGQLEYADQTMVSLSRTNSGDSIFETEMSLKIYDKKMNQIKTEKDLESIYNANPNADLVLNNVYTHTYERTGTDFKSMLQVQVIEEQVTDHSHTKSGRLMYSYHTDSSLPDNVKEGMNGAITVDLDCRLRN